MENPSCSVRYSPLVVLVLVLSAGLSDPAAHAQVQTISTAGRNVYRLVTADVVQGERLIVGSTYDNRVCAFTTAGQHRWDADVGGFVFDLAAGDLDGDASDEIVAAAADGWIYVFASDGSLRWKHDLGAPVYQAAVARLDGRSPVVLASGVSRELVAFSAQGERLAAAKLNGAGRMMRAGDFDGDGADEVAVLPIRGQAQNVCFFRSRKLTRLKESISSNVIPWDPVTRRSKDTGEAFRRGERNWTGLSLKKANGTVADFDRDGSAELIYPPGVYTLQGGLREVFALPETFKVASYDYHYNMRLLAAGDLAEPPGAEIVVVEGPAVRLYDATGKELGKAVAPLGFTSVAFLPGSPRGSVILGSSPNGDDNLNRLSFKPGWEKSLEGLERSGAMAQIGANLKQIADAAAAWHGEPMQGTEGPFDVIVSDHLWSGADAGKIDGWIAEVRDYERQFPYARLRFATAFWPGEDAPLLRPDGKSWGRDRRLAHDLTRDQIVAAAKRFEDARCHFWVQVGHGCDPHLEVATVAAMLEAAPTTLLGFISAEDEQLEDVPYYFEHHIKPILDLCLQHRKRFIPRNKDVWWAHWPAAARMREIIFNGRYRSVLLPSVEDSNSRSAEVNLAARVGLWLDGQVDDWASRCSADWFCASRAWEWEYGMTGQPQLRYYVSQAMLGARVFMMLSGERVSRTGGWTRVGAEGTATFLHLLGRGIITPPRRDQLKAISPVVLVMQQPSERFIRRDIDDKGIPLMTPKWLRFVTDAAASCLLLFVGLADAAPAATVHVWQRWETSLASSTSYTNPYADVDLQVTFTGPTGQTLHARGFWDGGPVFKIRCAFPQAGRWRWQTDCSDAGNAGLYNKSGTVEVGPYSGANPLFRHGFPRISANRRHLAHADGTPFLWIGDTAWLAYVRATDTEWACYAEDRSQRGFSVLVTSVSVTAGATDKQDSEGNAPFAGRDVSQWNPAFWQRLEAKVQSANAQGLVMVLTGVGFGRMKQAAPREVLAFARSLSARLAGNAVAYSPRQDWGVG